MSETQYLNIYPHLPQALVSTSSVQYYLPQNKNKNANKYRYKYANKYKNKQIQILNIYPQFPQALVSTSSLLFIEKYKSKYKYYIWKQLWKPEFSNRDKLFLRVLEFTKTISFSRIPSNLKNNDWCLENLLFSVLRKLPLVQSWTKECCLSSRVICTRKAVFHTTQDDRKFNFCLELDNGLIWKLEKGSYR